MLGFDVVPVTVTVESLNVRGGQVHQDKFECSNIKVSGICQLPFGISDVFLYRYFNNC